MKWLVWLWRRFSDFCNVDWIVALYGGWRALGSGVAAFFVGGATLADQPLWVALLVGLATLALFFAASYYAVAFVQNLTLKWRSRQIADQPQQISKASDDQAMASARARDIRLGERANTHRIEAEALLQREANRRLELEIERNRTAALQPVQPDALVPSAATFFSYPNDDELRLTIQNTSNREIQNCEVRLESLIDLKTGRHSSRGESFTEVAHGATRFSIPPLGRAAATILWIATADELGGARLVMLGGSAKGARAFAIEQLTGPWEINILIQGTNLSPVRHKQRYDGSGRI